MSNGNTAAFGPVTESEMREFFNRLVSTIVANTQTQRELDEVKAQLAEVNRRVTELVAEAQTLRQEVYQTTAQRDQAKKEAEENLLLANTYASERDRAREDCERVNALLVDARRTLADTTDGLHREEKDREAAQADRDYWKQRAEKAEAQVATGNGKLERVKGLLASFFVAEPVEKPTEVAYTPAEPERFQPTATGF